MPTPTTNDAWVTRIVALAIFASGFCGMVAEYSVGTTVSYLIGNSVAAYTVSISVFMLAMGVGAFVSKYSSEDNELECFLLVECILSGTAATSSTVIALAAQWGLTWGATIMVAFALGFLIGLEIPLLSRFIEKQKVMLKENLALVFGFDYLGSFVAGVLYSYWLLPMFGTVLTPVFSGAVNLVIAVTMFTMFRGRLKRTTGLALASIAAFAVTAGMFFHGEELVLDAEQEIYKDPIIYAEQTAYQKIMLTHKKGRYCLFLSGGKQFCSNDEDRYHEMLVHPAMWMNPDAQSVLVLGGGDGLALREILKYDHVTSVTLVDLDPRMVELCRTHPVIAELNAHAFEDPRVTVESADAFNWITENEELWDVIIADLPDPRRVELAKMYSHEFYSMTRDHLSPDGVIVVQSTSPLHAQEAYVTIWSTMQSAGLAVAPYRMNVPSFGDWGFNLGVRSGWLTTEQMVSRLDRFEERVPLNVLNRPAMQAATRFEKGIFPNDPKEAPVSRLANPEVHFAYQRAWQDAQ